MEEKDVVQALSALAQPVRLRVFRALVGAGPQGAIPTALADDLAVPASSLSFHLKELLHGGLISQERDGRHLIYRADFDGMNKAWDEWVVEGATPARATVEAKLAHADWKVEIVVTAAVP